MPPRSIDVQAWRKATREELLTYVKELGTVKAKPREERLSLLCVRTHLSTLDMYCYLRARFGEPNGFQNFLRSDSSDNLYHWDYNIRIDDNDLYIVASSREVHISVYEPMSDLDWKALIVAIKQDFGRVGPEKSAILKTLEKWVTFPNKFASIADLCSEHHSVISDILAATGEPFNVNGPALLAEGREGKAEDEEAGNPVNPVDPRLFAACTQLSLLTPIMAEAFVNMIILMQCRPEIRDDARQHEAFIRDHIDRKIFDLYYKCLAFRRPVDMTTNVYKNFKRVVDKRNHAIHGNIDPWRERLGIVYFDDKRPLYPEGGDQIARFYASLENQYQPRVVIKDYEDTYLMLIEISDAMDEEHRDKFWMVIQDTYPGYDLNRKKCGVLFGEQFVASYMEGQRYDDQLAVEW